ncbi:MAG: sigma-70 family RNA polymerase sigma factor [Caldilinea sp. CFX5]|nr:sigma-70 family RNA polymerase sigma factor [Caldilinea sp. CFX5]
MNQQIALITAAQQGDLAAFTQLVTQFQNMAYAVAYGATGDRHLAEEAAQEAFIEVYRHLGQLAEPAAFPGWLRTIVIRQVNRLTRRKRFPTIDLAAASVIATPEARMTTAAAELRQVVQDAIRALPAHERPVVLLYYLADYSQQEIAELLGVSVPAIKNRLYSARKRLRERLQTMIEESLQGQRPSADEQFMNKVLAMLKATAAGDTVGVTSLLAQTPALLNATGPVDYWSIPQTPLHVAVTNRNYAMIEHLLSQGADINNKDPEGQRPLDLVLGVDSAMVEFLLQRGAVIDIFAAATLGDLAQVRAFLTADPSLARAHGPEGATPLHLATTIELAQLLLDHGADINVPDHYTKRPPVGWGWGSKRDPIHRFLIEKGARVDTISLACRIGDVERVRTFLDTDPALLYTRTPTWDDHGEGATLLHIAVSRNRYAVTQLLIERGADVNAKGGWWVVTPLHWAADNGHTEIVRLLIAHGADVNARTEEHGYTPLHWAAGNSHRATVELLLASGAAVDAQSDSGETPNLGNL